MELNLDAPKKTLPRTYYLYLEKTGPFMQTAPACWQEFRQLLQPRQADLKLIGFFSLYKVHPEMIYRAAVMVDQRPDFNIPGLSFDEFEGGDYLNYQFKGSYAEMPEACGRVFDDLHEKRIVVGNNWGIENYLTNPETTPSDKNIVEILIPLT